MPEGRPTMSAQEAATFLGISRPTLLRLWAQGFLEGYRLTPYRNGQVRLYRDSVEAFDCQRKSQAPGGYRLPGFGLPTRCLANQEAQREPLS